MNHHGATINILKKGSNYKHFVNEPNAIYINTSTNSTLKINLNHFYFTDLTILGSLK